MKKRAHDKIATYFLENKLVVLCIVISGLLFDGLSCLIPIFQGKIMDELQTSLNGTTFILQAVAFLLFVLFVQVNRFLKRYFVRLFANKMTMTMRKKSYVSLLHSEVSLFKEQSRGDLMNKNLSDIKDTTEGIRKVTTEVFDSFVLLIGYTITLTLLDVKITLLSYIFIFLSIVAANLMAPIIYKRTKHYKKCVSEYKQMSIDRISNEVYNRGFGANQYYDEAMYQQMDEVEKSSIQSMLVKDSMQPLYSCIAILGVFFILYFGSLNYQASIWTIGDFSAYLTTYILVSTKASKIGKVFNAYQNAKVSWNRCKSFLKDVEYPMYLKKLSMTGLCVSSLSYSIQENVLLHQVSFSLKPGEVIGLCGKVHSGKSSLLNALSGLYTYEGSIKLNGVELKEVRMEDIPHFISYMPSSNELFTDSLENNVTLGKKGNVDSYLKKVLLLDEVQKMDQKEQTKLSHSVSNLSGGQQKRILLARCLYDHASLILLDNPFDSMDVMSSLEILKNIKADTKNSIIIIVNHQKEILKQMDRILYIHHSLQCDTYDNFYQQSEFRELMEGVIK